jgi:Protein of unknown function (DUF2752)
MQKAFSSSIPFVVPSRTTNGSILFCAARNFTQKDTFSPGRNVCYRASPKMTEPLSKLEIRKAASRRFAGLTLLTGILMASILIPPFHRNFFSICLLKDVFGIPCPGCGLTRAFLFLGHGDIRSALELNVNSLFVYSVVLFLWLAAVFNAITRYEIKLNILRHEIIALSILTTMVMLSGWTYNLLRNPWV